jgi:hypothetical protein
VCVSDRKNNTSLFRLDLLHSRWSWASRLSVKNVFNPDSIFRKTVENIKNNVFNYDNCKERKNKLVLIAANKVSTTLNSNYKLRRRIAKQMSPHEIDVYGGLWNSSLRNRMSHRLAVGLYSIKTGYFPNLIALYGSLFSKYRNYLGELENKHLIIQKYKYSLVIENSSDYCSEKLFDAILNGSILIYIGPKNNQISIIKLIFTNREDKISHNRNVNLFC